MPLENANIGDGAYIESAIIGAGSGISIGILLDQPFAVNEFLMGAGTIIGPAIYHLHRGDMERLKLWLSTNSTAQLVVNSVKNLF